MTSPLPRSDDSPAGTAEVAAPFRRGFLLTQYRHVRPVAHWSFVHLPGGWLSHDPEVPLAFVRTDEAWLVLLGHARDVTQDLPGLRQLATSLLDAAVRGRSALDERLDDLAGRFVVIDGDGPRTSVQTDATGARSAFVAGDGPDRLVGSHINLTAEAASSTAPATLHAAHVEAQGMMTFPGRRTSFANVVALTPNTEIDLGSGVLRRTWPRRPVSYRTPADVAETLSLLLARDVSAAFAVPGAHAVVDTTLASRLALAVGRPHVRGVRWWLRATAPDGVAGDAEREIAHRARLRPDTLPTRLGRPEGPLHQTVRRNVPRLPPTPQVAAYAATLPSDAPVLRFDALRVFEPNGADSLPVRDVSPDRLVSLYARDVDVNQSGIRDAFADYLMAADVAGALGLGVDARTLLAWEYELGTRAATEYLALDAAVTPVPVGNARVVLDLFLSQRPDQLRRGTASSYVIESDWPALLEMPIPGIGAAGDRDTVRRRALRPTPEEGPLPSHDAALGLPIHQHESLEALQTLPETPVSRHRIALEPDDDRGRHLASMFGAVELDMKLTTRSGRALVVVAAGAADPTRQPHPYFAPFAVADDWQHASVMWVADPMRRLSRALSTGWYVGPAMTDVAWHCALLATRVATLLDADHVVFVGENSGGFAALSMARYVPGSTALAFSPDSRVLDAPPALVHRFLTAAFPGLPTAEIVRAFSDRLDLTIGGGLSIDHEVRIVQGETTAQHRAQHYEPLTRALGVEEGTGGSADGRVRVEHVDYRAPGPAPANLVRRHVKAAVKRR